MESTQRTAHVTVQARHFWCEGDVVLPAGAYKGRVNDVLNGNEEFIAMTDVTMYQEGSLSDEPMKYRVLLVRKGEIEYLVPLD